MADTALTYDDFPANRWDTSDLDFSVMTDRAPGIYFDLSEDDYHADKSLSASGMKDLLTGPLQYWVYRWADPPVERKRTDALDKGSALHTLLLEGEDKFSEKIAFLPPDFNGRTNAGKALKAELEAKHDIVLKDEARAEFDRIKAVLRAMPDIGRAFEGGWPEVSIFWRDPLTNIPMKARVDYAKPGVFIDLKSFANMFSEPIESAVTKAIHRFSYGIQAIQYTEGHEALAQLGADNIAINGPLNNVKQALALLAFAPRYYFLFAQKGEVPDMVCREFARTDDHAGLGSSPNAYWIVAQQKRQRAIARFIQCWRRFGGPQDTPWLTPRGLHQFKDTDFPAYALEDKEESIDA